MSRNSRKASQSGFTLIETLIYVAFLSLMMGTLLGITFSTLDATGQVSKKIVVQQEANFLLRKMTWALTGASAITVTNGHNLVISRSSAPTTVSFDSNGNFVDMNSGAGQLHLNSQNAIVSALNFVKTSSQPVKIEGSFTVTHSSDPSNTQNLNSPDIYDNDSP